jgi:hypothetical protein
MPGLLRQKLANSKPNENSLFRIIAGADAR